MDHNKRSSYARQLSRFQLIGISVSAIAFGAIFVAVWQFGELLLLGAPLQISLISIFLPILLGAVIIWFARKHDQLSWKRDDER